MTAPLKAATSIFFISLLGIPASYIVNTAHTTQGELGLFVAGIVCLTAISVLTYVALASFKQPKDWLFYGEYCIMFFCFTIYKEIANFVVKPISDFQWMWLWNWHRHWLVVWSCPGSTTAVLCSMALQAMASRSCCDHRTTQLGSFSNHQNDPTPARCWRRYTGCPFSRGSSTKWLCWHLKSTAPRHCRTCVS